MTTLSQQTEEACCKLEVPCRNNYFTGKFLEAHHFELESDYQNAKRQLINRLVHGYGVVCGLNVKEEDCDVLIIQPGVAIDPWGREIIVPCDYHLQIADVARPVCQEKPCEGDMCDAHIVLCYCESPKQTAPAENCDRQQPDTICEGFKIKFRPGHLPCPLPLPQKDLIDGVVALQIDQNGVEPDFDVHYKCMVEWISKECFCPEDACVALANIQLKYRPCKWRLDINSIDITVRPIVYTNDLLRHLIYSLARTEGQNQKNKTPQHK